MIRRTRLLLGTTHAPIAAVRWDDGTIDRPPALLVHGTGFAAELWDAVARGLAARYTVYAIDRRGHGYSHKPDDGGAYHFLDFALDTRAVLEELELHQALAVGHSAGATDLLLAAALAPARIGGVFAMEPTVMDPRSPRAGREQLSDERKHFVERTRRRRREFASATAAIERLRAAPAFSHWRQDALRCYVEHGFEALDDGRVRLRCPPEIEAAMLVPIFEAMEEVYAGDARGNPFTSLEALRCPVRVSTTERSGAIYKAMAERALSLIPGASPWHFAGAGHCVAQEAPDAVLRALGAFVGETGGAP